MTRSRSLLLATLVAASLLAGGAAAASDGSIVADPPAANESAVHTATVTVGGEADGPTLTGIALTYPRGVNLSNVSVADVRLVGVDRGDDEDGAAVDANLTANVTRVSVSNGGRTLSIAIGGRTVLSAGDEVVVVVENVENPPNPGTYQVGLDVNPARSGGRTNASLQITSGRGAAVVLDDQRTNGTRLVVRTVLLPDGGFVVIHDASGVTRGHTGYLEPGTHSSVVVRLNRPLDADQRLSATLVRDDGDGVYEYPQQDRLYTTADGQPISDSARVVVTGGNGGDNATSPGSVLSTPTSSRTATGSNGTGDGTATTTATTTTVPGFTAVCGLAALVVACLLARHRG